MLISGLVAFGLTLAISPVVLVGLRRLGVMDIPSHRSSHVDPTPRGGGIAVCIGVATALVTASSLTGRPRAAVLVAACGFGLVGLIDDLLSAPALWRLASQVAISVLAVVWLLPSSEQSLTVQIAIALLIILWLVSYVNAYNFMDGINGISVAQALIAGVTWIAIGEIRDLPGLATAGVVVAAAALGFAPFNFPRAKMFLGDSGSYFIGAYLASVTILFVRSGVPLEAVAAPLALYLADTGTTLVRRLRRGDNWHAAHREHTYQRLVDQGWSHGTTTLVVGLCLVVVSSFALLSLTDSVALRVVGDIVAAAILAGYLRVPDWLAARPKGPAVTTSDH